MAGKVSIPTSVFGGRDHKEHNGPQGTQGKSGHNCEASSSLRFVEGFIPQREHAVRRAKDTNAVCDSKEYLIQSERFYIRSQLCDVMDIFAAVKKFSLTIFTSLLLVIAFVNAGNIPFGKYSEAIKHVENSDTFCAAANPAQPDFERSNTYSVHSAVNHCRHHSAVSDLHSSATFRITGLAFTQCIAEEQGEPRVKQYLHDIYPSHNFW